MTSTDRKLGKLPPRHDPRTLKLERYLVPAELPTPPPATTRHDAQMQFPMFMNDRIGDCTCASMAHMVEFWRYNNHAKVAITDADVLQAYRDISGYDPATGENDNGAVELDVLKYWRKTGIARHTIGAFASIDPQDTTLVRTANYLFYGVYIGVALPKTAQGQRVWDVVAGKSADSEPGSWGGHAVNVVDYDEDGVTIITWGAPLLMTWDFWNKYVEEAWAVLSRDSLTGNKTPDGFDFTQLQHDLHAITK